MDQYLGHMRTTVQPAWHEQLALVVHGVHLLENLKLDEMVAKNVSEFVLVMQPMKMQGTTGSTVAPIALR